MDSKRPVKCPNCLTAGDLYVQPPQEYTRPRSVQMADQFCSKPGLKGSKRVLMVRRGLGRRPVVVLAWREFSEISVVFYAENTFQNTQLVQAWAPVFIPPTTGGRSMSLRGKSSSLHQNLRFFTLWRFLWGQLEAFFRRGLDFGMTLSIVHSRCGFRKTGCWGYEWAVTSVPVSAE